MLGYVCIYVRMRVCMDALYVRFVMCVFISACYVCMYVCIFGTYAMYVCYVV